MKHLNLILSVAAIALTTASCEEKIPEWKKNMDTEVQDTVIFYPESLVLGPEWQEVKVSTIPDDTEYYFSYDLQSDLEIDVECFGDNVYKGEKIIKVRSKSGAISTKYSLAAVSAKTNTYILGILSSTVKSELDTSPAIKFEPASFNLPSDGQWHEITIKPASDDMQYYLLFADDVYDYVAFGEGYHQSMRGEQTIYIGTGYKGKKHTVTINAIPYPGFCFNGKLEITVGK